MIRPEPKLKAWRVWGGYQLRWATGERVNIGRPDEGWDERDDYSQDRTIYPTEAEADAALLTYPDRFPEREQLP